MSRNQRRRKTHSKQKNISKKNSIKTVEGSNILSNQIEKSKEFFSKITKDRDYKTLISEFFTNSKAYVIENKKSVVLATSIVAVLAIGYFGFVDISEEDTAKRKLENEANYVSIELSSNETTDSDLNDEIAQITLKSNEVETLDENKTPEEVERLENVIQINEITADTITTLEYSKSIENDATLSTDILNVSSMKTEINSEFTSVANSVLLGVQMYAITVDNKAIAYLETEEQGREVLEQLRQKYANEEAVEESIEFKEKVDVVKVKRDIFDYDGYKTVEEVLEFIIKGTNEQRIHKVVEGENFWVIAHKYDLNVKELEDANPDIKPERLQIDTELSLIVAEPIVNVITVAQLERVDQIPYGSAPNEKTDKYYEGEYFTKRAGVNGEAEVKVVIYKENGKLIGEKTIEKQIIKEPIEKIVYEGTKPAPPRIGTGTFDKPTSRGYISSGFGARRLGYHRGIDIALPSGSAVYAADGGTVIYSGWKGTYGKLVKINHGANLETRYAHNSVLLVGVGDNVFKGQKIALSGNTGRSTGPHLHFEVRKNGNPQNPKKYVTY